MRLIDADAIKKEFCKDIMGGLNWERIIDNAPTVDTKCTNCDSGYAQGYSDGYLKGKEDRPQGMTNAEIFKQTFGFYATEVWSMRERDFLEWLNSEAKI